MMNQFSRRVLCEHLFGRRAIVIDDQGARRAPYLLRASRHRNHHYHLCWSQIRIMKPPAPKLPATYAMKRSLLHVATLLLIGFTSIAVCGADEPSAPSLPGKHKVLLDAFCVKCHGPDKQNGKFRVDDLSLSIDNLETAERWQKVLNAMNSGDMPPEDQQQPPNSAKADLLDDLANLMVRAGSDFPISTV